jgi:hypothetical protein
VYLAGSASNAALQAAEQNQYVWPPKVLLPAALAGSTAIPQAGSIVFVLVSMDRPPQRACLYIRSSTSP